jgi:cyclopropane fatty-acyl-phospholipid synthase-like methyltransferase
MASREELLQSIRPSMKLDRAFFMKVYGYEITWPGFVETALHRFEVLGCTRAREYYQKTVSDYEARREEDLKEVAAMYHQQLEMKWRKEEGEEWSGSRRKKYRFIGFPQDW